MRLRTRQRAPTPDTKSSVHRNKQRDIRFKMKKLLLCEKLLLEDEKNLEIEKKKANHTYNKGSLSRIHKNLNRHLTKDNIRKAIKLMKACSTSDVTREIEIKMYDTTTQLKG